ncbi:hypothetical protein D2V17_05885 [Aurantiacibacter xanthus]|uniref:Uncharacterized protein n=2 Tax=Aurantiacibacter xanthus TaxID=1784712 RepID=A0A3A1P9C1_9SPHN|nr:hypothetical protein D2V17_05885 [Aurantiacibacter xanthus]
MAFPPRWDTEKDEMVLCTVGPNSLDNPQYNMKLQMLIAMRHIEGLQGGPATSIFRAMSSEVRRVVMATEAETVRIIESRP